MSNRDEQIKKAVARGMNKSAQGAAMAGNLAEKANEQSGGDQGMIEQMGDFVGDSMPSMGDIGDFWGSAASANEGPAGGAADKKTKEEEEFWDKAAEMLVEKTGQNEGIMGMDMIDDEGNATDTGLFASSVMPQVSTQAENIEGDTMTEDIMSSTQNAAGGEAKKDLLGADNVNVDSFWDQASDQLVGEDAGSVADFTKHVGNELDDAVFGE